MRKGIVAMQPSQVRQVYDDETLNRMAQVLVFDRHCVDPQFIEAHDLTAVEVLITGWGAPKLDQAFLDQAPSLKLVLYGAGTLRGTVTDAFWQRNIRVCTARAANAVPVSEYTLAVILLSLKQFWQRQRDMRTYRSFASTMGTPPGGYGSTVGLISLSSVGKLVQQRLASYDIHVIAYDPFQTTADVEQVPLDELFARSDVVSLHTPWLPKTEGLITEDLLASMKRGATFINTARGAIVDEPALIRVLSARQDLHAVLDVTYPEPPAPESLLWTLPNVTLTPHIAGSIGNECRRMGALMADELERYVTGQPLLHEVTAELAQNLA